MNKCIFLDREDYTFLPEDFKIIDGVPESIEKNGSTVIFNE